MKKTISIILSIIMLCIFTNFSAYSDTVTVNDIMWNATCNYNDGLYYEALGELSALSRLNLTSKEQYDLDVLKEKINVALNNQTDVMSRIHKVQDFINQKMYFEASDALYRLTENYPSLPPSENNIVWNLSVDIKNAFSEMAMKEYPAISKYIKNGLYYEAIALCDKTLGHYYCRWTLMLNDDTKSKIMSARNTAQNKLNDYLKKNSPSSSSNNSSYLSGTNSSKYSECSHCKGSGRIICSKCNGKGTILVTDYSHSYTDDILKQDTGLVDPWDILYAEILTGFKKNKTCTDCNGKGYNMCTYCKGTGKR